MGFQHVYAFCTVPAPTSNAEMGHLPTGLRTRKPRLLYRIFYEVAVLKTTAEAIDPVAG